MAKTWFQRSKTEVETELSVKLSDGLSTAESAKRLRQYGRNELQAGKPINPLTLLFSQFKDVLVIVLLISALVSLGLSFVSTSSDTNKKLSEAMYCNRSTEEARLTDAYCQAPATVCESQYKSWYEELCAKSQEEKAERSEGPKEAILIFAIVLAIALIGFFNEYKAEKTVEALKKLVGQKAKIRRNGKIIEIDAVELVVGDVVLLDEGQKIPADIRLLTVKNMQVNEASLTGESVPVSKNDLDLTGDKSLGDQKNMAFAGTFVTQGTAEGIVTATGQRTELGKIASLVNDVESEETPMQRKLNDLGKRLGLMILAVCVVVFIIVLFFVEEARNKDVIARMVFAFTAAVALAVAAIPEGLAFVVRISLALGARRMAGKNALVRKLSAVEALGSTDVICSDKTGTLTRGEMTVRELYIDGQSVQLSGSGYDPKGDFTSAGNSFDIKNKNMQALLLAGALCNNAHLKGLSVLGDPTEGSLLVSAGKAGINYDKVQSTYTRVDEVPFTSDRKLMSTVHKVKGSYVVYSKGAVEMILNKCTHMLDAKGKTVVLTKAHKDAIIDKNKALASQALRVLGFAMRDSKTLPKGEKAIESKLVFIGLQAMMDPPRDEVISVIHRVQSEAGMRVVMITGDYIETAKAIATEIGITGEAISGVELDTMTQKEFEERVEHISVYARVNPEHKIRIVQALKKHGHQVAMTGDGVNDAPAIKAADIGIAMGITGTDASKEAADLILLDDKFVTIINAIEEGRGIFDNVRKFVNFLISCNIAEVLAILFGIIFFNNLLLTAAQLLFINIVTDGLPAVALGSDPSRADVLKDKPKHFQEAILSKRVWVEIFVFGTLMTIALLLQYWYNHTHEGTLAAVSAAFTSMVIYEIVRLVDIRTDYKIKWLANPWLTVSIALSLIIHFAVLYIPAFASYFKVGPLAYHDWVFMLVGSAVLFITMKLLNPLFDRIGSEA